MILDTISTFNNVRSSDLRAWNRFNIVCNLKEHFGNNKMADAYLRKIDRNGQVEIAKMAVRIYKDGYTNVRREIMRTNNA